MILGVERRGGGSIRRKSIENNTGISVSGVVRLFYHLGVPPSTAAGDAMPMRGERRIVPVSDELRMKIIHYRTAMSVVKQMVLEGIISEEEYSEIDTILRAKYAISLSTIFG